MYDTVRLILRNSARGREVSAVGAAKRTKDSMPEEVDELIFFIVLAHQVMLMLV